MTVPTPSTDTETRTVGRSAGRARWRVLLARAMPTRAVPWRLIAMAVGLARKLVLAIVPARLLRRRLTLLVPVAGVVLLMGMVAAMKLRGGEVLAPVPFETLDPAALIVEVPESVKAGDAFEIAVSGEALAEGDEVIVMVETGYEHRRLVATVEAGRAVTKYEPAAGPAAGVFTVAATSRTAAGSATTDVEPGRAVDPVEIYLGPRTIEATATTATMVVVVGEDRFGNPVSDGTPVEVLVTRPDQQSETFTLHTDRLLAWSRILSGTVAGRSKLAVTVDDGHGKELDFLEIAGSPAPFEVLVLDPPIPADGRSLVRVRTGELVDPFGNLLPDGIDVFADVRGPGGTRRLRAQVIGGRAEFTIEAPSRPGSEMVTVSASGTVSDPVEIVFDAMVLGFDAEARPHRDGVEVRIGPVISTLGAYVPDGTTAVITADSGTAEVPLFDGYADVVIPATDGPVTVEILGAQQTAAMAASS